jgi:hypothetical protein
MRFLTLKTGIMTSVSDILAILLSFAWLVSFPCKALKLEWKDERAFGWHLPSCNCSVQLWHIVSYSVTSISTGFNYRRSLKWTDSFSWHMLSRPTRFDCKDYPNLPPSPQLEDKEENSLCSSWPYYVVCLDADNAAGLHFMKLTISRWWMNVDVF